MNSWVVLGLVATIFWAFSNIIDKVAVDRLIKSPKQFIFLLSQYYSLIGLLYLAFFFSGNSVNLYALLCGVMLFGLYYYYAEVIPHEEMTSVIIVHQSEPVFVLILSLMIFQDSPDLVEWIGFCTILSGMIFFCLPEKKTARHSILARSVMLLTVSAFLGSISTILADIASKHLSPLDVLGQSALSYGTTGLLFMAFSKPYRAEARQALIVNRWRKTVAIGLTGLMDTFGYVSFFAALKLAENPSLVAILTSMHPVFVFLLGTLLTILAPKIYSEGVSRYEIVKKLFAILIVTVGVILLA